MGLRTRVAVFAGKSRGERFKIELSIFDCAAAVTSEAGGNFLMIGFTAHRLRQAVGLKAFVSHRYGQAADRGIVTDEAFKKVAILLQDVGLNMRPKRVMDGERHGILAIRYGVCGVPIGGLHRITVAAFFERHLRMSLQDGQIRRQFHANTHGCLRLIQRLLTMTGDTG